jgi:hypothetical protein
MSNRAGSLFLLTLFLALSAYAQETAPPSGPKAPAPHRNLNGVWLGGAVMRLEPVPEMTAWGREQFEAAKPLYGPRALPVAESNHGLVTCDPLGFPQNILYELRSVEFQETQNKMLQLFQYQRVWRDIWTDGRSLPADVGSDTPASPIRDGTAIRWADGWTTIRSWFSPPDLTKRAGATPMVTRAA